MTVKTADSCCSQSTHSPVENKQLEAFNIATIQVTHQDWGHLKEESDPPQDEGEKGRETEDGSGVSYKTPLRHTKNILIRCIRD